LHQHSQTRSFPKPTLMLLPLVVALLLLLPLLLLLVQQPLQRCP
jgi:hypothetical protein